LTVSSTSLYNAPPTTQPPPGHQKVRSYRNWNPPLLGNLPDDFLRILPQQLDSIKWTAPSGSAPGTAGSNGVSAHSTGPTEQDKKLKQYLEDERIALFLQNEEFMRELQRNREFLIALERGTTHFIYLFTLFYCSFEKDMFTRDYLFYLSVISMGLLNDVFVSYSSNNRELPFKSTCLTTDRIKYVNNLIITYYFGLSMWISH
uniref:CUE domain-containing protein n=1 Tax=Periophthalmus magnuspinnatus TaxID=409849 RepID=A0A3B4BCR0_9GOBI